MTIRDVFDVNSAAFYLMAFQACQNYEGNIYNVQYYFIGLKYQNISLKCENRGYLPGKCYLKWKILCFSRLNDKLDLKMRIGRNMEIS